MVLQQRLSSVLEKKGLRSNYQFGFRSGRGTQDAALVLQALADHYVGENRRRLYVAFVDFSKAFDCVNRDLLWKRLEQLGVGGTFLQALKSYYDSVLFRVNTKEGLTEAFEAETGVKQGCPLSPELFGCFIEAFADSLDGKEGLGIDAPTLSGLKVPSIIFADDLTPISTSHKGLQRLLDALSDFCTATRMTVNDKKTKYMVISRGKVQRKATLEYRGKEIEQVDEFRLLGVPVFSAHGKAKKVAEVLSQAAAKRYRVMMSRARTLGIQDYTTLQKLFDATVTSVMTYGGIVFGPFLAANHDFSSPNSLELLHRKFLRASTGCPQQTPSGALLLECDRVPMDVILSRRIFKFLRKIPTLPENDVIRRALQTSVSDSYHRGAKSWSDHTADNWAYSVYDMVCDDKPSRHPVELTLEVFVDTVIEKQESFQKRVMEGYRRRHSEGLGSTKITETPPPGLQETLRRHHALLLLQPKRQHLTDMKTYSERSLYVSLRVLPVVKGLATFSEGIPSMKKKVQCSCEKQLCLDHALVCREEEQVERREKHGLSDSKGLLAELQQYNIERAKKLTSFFREARYSAGL
jgi:hypothetical protein